MRKSPKDTKKECSDKSGEDVNPKCPSVAKTNNSNSQTQYQVQTQLPELPPSDSLTIRSSPHVLSQFQLLENHTNFRDIHTNFRDNNHVNFRDDNQNFSHTQSMVVARGV